MQLLHCKGCSLRYLPGRGNTCCCVVVLYVGEGPRGNSATCLALTGFQSLPLPPTSKLGPSGADSRVGGFVYVLGPLWFSPRNSPSRLGVSPTATTPTGVFSQRFRDFISLHWHPVLHSLSHSPDFTSSLSACECGTACSTSHGLAYPVLQPPPCHKSSLP